MNTGSYITVIGRANIDISAKTIGSLVPQDSNPSVITKSAGGVGRNIAENLARLGASVKLIAAFGGDALGKQLLDECRSIGIDVQHCRVNQYAMTSTYIAILNQDGEMHVGAVDDSNALTVADIQASAVVLNGSAVIVVDTNLDEKVITDILDAFPNNDIFVDAISTTKARRIRDNVGRFHTVKMNSLEAAVLAGFKIDTEADLERAGDYFLRKGTKCIAISLGAQGLYYRTRDESIRLCPQPLVPKNATGAGDALMAGLVYCAVRGESARRTAEFAQAMARHTIMSETAVSTQINTEVIMKQM